MVIEPRYPMFGGWRTAFTIGYSLPLQDFLFQSEGQRYVNISFGSPVNEVVIDTLIVKVSYKIMVWDFILTLNRVFPFGLGRAWGKYSNQLRKVSIL